MTFEENAHAEISASNGLSKWLRNVPIATLDREHSTFRSEMPISGDHLARKAV